MARLSVGDTAPDFTLPTASGEDLHLADVLASGRRAVVYFYPAAGTPGCTTQACDFRDNLASLQGSGFAVIGISPDTLEKLRRFAEKESLSFPLAADPDRAVLEAYGAWGEKSLYGKLVTGVIRSTFVVGTNGRIELAQYAVKAKGHVAKLRRDLGLD
jgi:peroxiredoxin Q/BCP